MYLDQNLTQSFRLSRSKAYRADPLPWKLNQRSHKLGVSKASSTDPIACLREGSGGWHYSTTALQPEASAVPERESHEKIPWKIRLREKEDNTRKLTPRVWSTVSLTSSWMSPDQVVETMLISVTWPRCTQVLIVFTPTFPPQLRAAGCLIRNCFKQSFNSQFFFSPVTWFDALRLLYFFLFVCFAQISPWVIYNLMTDFSSLLWISFC